MPEEYMTYTRASTFPTPTVEDLLRMKKELEEKIISEADEMVFMIIPKGSKVMVMTPDGRLLHTKEKFEPVMPTLGMTVEPPEYKPFHKLDYPRDFQ